jgi:lathosterol oxidase
MWLILAVTGLVFVNLSIWCLFYKFYWPSQVTYEKWIHKTNPTFPPVWQVRKEMIMTSKGLIVAAFCPALSLWLTAHGKSHANCDAPSETGWGYFAFSVVAVLVGVDLFEFAYHRLGHSVSMVWSQHKHHHKFYNPSPFASLADELFDQFVRSSPMLLFPIFMPINMDMLFMLFLTLFTYYGVYLHVGYELESIDAHHPFINTSYQHLCHHSLSILNKPYHCGFFVKTWDQLTGGMYPGACFCAKCERKKGNRSRELFAQVVVPDYSVLLKPSFWLSSNKDDKIVESEDVYPLKESQKLKAR